jgi:type VI secretion system protein ImpC
MPRFLARLPYGAKTIPVEEFEFEEDTLNFTWANSAFAMGANIARAFTLYGWCARIRGVESGGAIESLPVYTFPTDDGGLDQKCPTEIAITDRREVELSSCGIAPLIHRKNSDSAVFVSVNSLRQPVVYDDPDATAEARLAVRLPYLFAGCRFAQYIKCLVRDRSGAFTERGDLQRYLQDWLLNYVDADPSNSSEELKARKPLAGAEIIVDDVPGNPERRVGKLYLRPHYQLEGNFSMRLLIEMPAQQP